LQQAIGVYVRHSKELGQETEAQIQALFPPATSLVAIYNPRNVDMLKLLFDYSHYSQNKAEYNKLYLSLFAKYPFEYVETFFQNSLSYWSPINENPDLIANKLFGLMQPIEDFSDAKIPDLLSVWYPAGKVPNIGNYSDFSGNPLYPFYHFFAKGETAQKIPLFGFFYSYGFVFWLIVLLLAYVLYGLKRSKARVSLLIPLGLLFFYFLTLFLGPAPVMRLVYPILLILPLLVGMVIRKEKL
jgi:hypothetical protein